LSGASLDRRLPRTSSEHPLQTARSLLLLTPESDNVHGPTPKQSAAAPTKPVSQLAEAESVAFRVSSTLHDDVDTPPPGYTRQRASGVRQARLHRHRSVTWATRWRAQPPNRRRDPPPLGPSRVDQSSDEVDAGTLTIALLKPDNGAAMPNQIALLLPMPISRVVHAVDVRRRAVAPDEPT
jgi:hypothetical protein